MGAAYAKDFGGFLDRLNHLKLDKAVGPVKPYKPILLMTVLIQIAKGKQRSRYVFFDGGLKSAFKQLLGRVHPNWQFKADPRYPFAALENDAVWELVPFEGALEDLQSARNLGQRARDLMKHVECARLPEPVFESLVQDPGAIHRALAVLLERYPECLPPHTGGEIIKLLGDAGGAPPAGGEDLSERAIEEFIETHWSATPFAEMGVRLSSVKSHGMPGRQVMTPVSTIDLLGFQPAERTWWVLELKRGRPADAVVGQVSRYLGWVAAERRDRNERAVGAVVAASADERLRFAVQANPNLSLWTFDSDLRISRCA